MAHIHSIYDTEPRYVIDPVTRSITCKSKVEEAVVQGDHNSERFAFEIPRFVDGHDMSLCNRVQVHYINTSQRQGSHSDIYPVDDLQIDPNNNELVICSWLISNRATELDGALNFVLRFMCVTGETIDYAWSTVPYTGIKVLKGIVNYDEIIEDEYSSDLIEAWYNQLMSAGTNGVNIVEQAKNDALSEFDAHVDATRESFYNDIRENVANAIKKTVSGDIIQVDDVSPVEHTVNVYTHGKNLFDASTIEVQEASNCYISAVGEDYIEITTVSGYTGNGYETTGKKLKDLCPQMKVGRTYTVSANTDSIMKMFYLNYTDTLITFGTSFIVTEQMLNCHVGFYGYDARDNGAIGVCRISNIQIEEGETATDYEPYIDPTNLTVTVSGKNFVDVSKVVSDTQNQVINNGNGTVTVNTTPTSSAVPIAGVTLQMLATGLKAGETYTLSADSTGKQKMIWLDSANVSWDFGTSKVVTQEMLNSVVFLYASGNSTTATVSNIQIELGSEITTYEAFKSAEIYQPSEDGTCKVASVSPTMTIFADRDLSLEATYNRDTTAVFDEINVLLETLLNGGVQT